MATSNNPLLSNPRPHTEELQDHHHDVPIVNIKDNDRVTLQYESPETVEEEEKTILEFDEADSLFGRRSQVKDSHGRY